MLTAAILTLLGALAAALAHIDRQRREIRRVTGERDVAREAHAELRAAGLRANKVAFDRAGCKR